MNGIVSFGTYIPSFSIDRQTIVAALGEAEASGSRSVAAFDEDTTTMGVEAARRALEPLPASFRPQGLFLSTTNPAYLDTTNAVAIWSALGFDRNGIAADFNGSVRSGVAAIRTAIESESSRIVVLSDIRTGLPGSGDERNGGDAAAALVFGSGPEMIAEYIGGSSLTAEILDRWRVPGDQASRQWEERFGEHAYVPLAASALAEAFAQAGIVVEDIDHLVVTGTHSRAVRMVAGYVGARPEALVDDLSSTVGNAGAAHAGLLIASALERAEPGQLLAVVVLADGCDVVLFRTTEVVTSRRAAYKIRCAEARPIRYETFLTWRGFLDRQPPQRPHPQRPSAPAALRNVEWKFAFTGSRCHECGARHLPPQRICVGCGSVDRMGAERLADEEATVATFTIDRLAFSLSGPVVLGVFDFDGGGRFQGELTDVDPASVRIGDRVEMTFRRMSTSDGVHNYFWKARPVRGEAS